MRVLLVAFLLLLHVPAGSAEPLSAQEQTALDETRDRFIKALEELEFDVMVSAIPPGVLRHIAEITQVPLEALYEGMPAVLEASMAGVAITRMDMDTEDLDAVRLEHQGKAYVYGFAPTVVEMAAYGSRYRVDCGTLALLEEGKWYLVRTTEEQQVTILRAVYPFFQDVEFPEGKLVRVE